MLFSYFLIILKRIKIFNVTKRVRGTSKKPQCLYNLSVCAIVLFLCQTNPSLAMIGQVLKFMFGKCAFYRTDSENIEIMVLAIFTLETKLY